ncbi:MAG: YihY/virulence factor BrkB family protein [Lachnospiraceae bacterium]|nr:YihY/virulence factor BrkB family protein [Lachnospiraceae bacterium]
MWKLFAVTKELVTEIKKDNVGAYAAQAAYFLIVSAIPFMILLLTVVQHTAISRQHLMELMRTYLPGEVSPFLIRITGEMYYKSGSIVWMAIITALWSSAKGAQYLSSGLNAIYNIKENRNWLILRIRAIAYTILFLAGIIFSILFVMLGKFIQSKISGYIPWLDRAIETIMSWRHFIIFFVLTLLFLFIFKFLPNRYATFKSQLPAAIITSFAWMAMSGCIALYVNKFNGFSIYGSMTTIVLILMYVYFGMYLLLVCAEVDSMYEYIIRGKLRKLKKVMSEKRIS